MGKARSRMAVTASTMPNKLILEKASAKKKWPTTAESRMMPALLIGTTMLPSNPEPKASRKKWMEKKFGIPSTIPPSMDRASMFT